MKCLFYMLSAFCFHKKIALKGELDANYEKTILDSKTQVRNVVLKMTFACSRDRKKVLLHRLFLLFICIII